MPVRPQHSPDSARHVHVRSVPAGDGVAPGPSGRILGSTLISVRDKQSQTRWILPVPTSQRQKLSSMAELGINQALVLNPVRSSGTPPDGLQLQADRVVLFLSFFEPRPFLAPASGDQADTEQAVFCENALPRELLPPLADCFQLWREPQQLAEALPASGRKEPQ